MKKIYYIAIKYTYCDRIVGKFKTELTVSSEQIAESCVQNIIAVKMPNKTASNRRKIRNTVVAAGEYEEQSEKTPNENTI